MSRNIVTLTGTAVHVEPRGLDKLWSFRRELEVPVSHVKSARHDLGMREAPKGWRGPGLRLGSKLSGTFHADGQRQFWNIAGYDKVLVLELAPGERFSRLILTVDNPHECAHAINAAIANKD